VTNPGPTIGRTSEGEQAVALKRAATGSKKEIGVRSTKRDGEVLLKPFLWGVPVTAVWFALVLALKHFLGSPPPSTNFFDWLYLFFYRTGQREIQCVTTYLFCVGCAFLVARWRRLRTERHVADDAERDAETRIHDEGSGLISRELALRMADAVPEGFRQRIGVRRLYELLRGYASGEEPITLNEELSRRDVDEVERGHLLLNTMKQLIPVLGFFGTVVGLSMGMTKFPQAAAAADSVDKLRMILRDFASSLSVAFDTTLLALVYAIILVVLASVLKQQEEAFVASIDEVARDMITKFRDAVAPATASVGSAIGDVLAVLQRWSPELEQVLARTNGALVAGLTAQLDRLCQAIEGSTERQTAELNRRLDGLEQKVSRPPRYAITVQPAPDENRG
jgi:biopolymer transport protein ExbB/TolQ